MLHGNNAVTRSQRRRDTVSPESSPWRVYQRLHAEEDAVQSEEDTSDRQGSTPSTSSMSSHATTSSESDDVEVRSQTIEL